MPVDDARGWLKRSQTAPVNLDAGLDVTHRQLVGYNCNHNRRVIRKAFGHAAAPTKGPSAVKYAVNRHKIRVTGKTLLQFSREDWN